jgi:hypothetical protein
MPVTAEQNTVRLSAAATSPTTSGSVLTGTIHDNGAQVGSRSDTESNEVIYLSVTLETLI